MRRWIAILLLSLTAGCLPQEDVLPTLAVLSTEAPGALIPLAFWETQPGRVDGSTTATYVLEGQAGDSIRVGAVTTGAPVTLALVDISGVVIASGRSVETRLPADGLYRVVVRAEGVSEYVIGLSYTDRPNPNQPTPVRVVVGAPTPTLDHD